MTEKRTKGYRSTWALTPKQIAWLRRRATKLQCSQSEALRRALDEHMAQAS